MIFIPRSHVALHDAINKIGSLMHDNWSEEELNPDIWKTDRNYERLLEIEERIVESIAKNALNEWGDDWIQAADRFIKQFDLEIIYIRHKTKIDALKKNLNEDQAFGWVILLEAAQYIYKQAKHRYRSIPSAGLGFDSIKTTIQPPFFETKEGSDPIELDKGALASYERGAEEEFAKIYKLRLEMQSRFTTVINWFQQEMFEGQLACAYLVETGQLVSISQENWATDCALELFKTCQIEGHQLLVSKNYLERYNATSCLKLRTGRKPKYDWKAAKQHIIKMFEHHGALSQDDPDWSCQADVEKSIKKFFLDSCGQEPVTSTVREKAKLFISEVEVGNS